MLKTDLLLALRQMRRRPLTAFVNVFGLALGLASFALVALYVRDEWAYDRHHRDAERIVRVVKDFVNDDGTRVPDATTPPALMPVLLHDLPDLEAATRVFPPWNWKPLISVGEHNYLEEKFLRIDSTFFNVFTVPFIHGDPKTCFAQPRSIVLTERLARKYFGAADPMGQLVRIENRADFTVSAVVADPPRQGHFDYDFLIHVRSLSRDMSNNFGMDSDWGWYNFYTYAKLQPGVTIQQIEPKIRDLFKRYQPDNTNYFYVQPLVGAQGIHLASNLKWELAPNGDARHLYIFGAVALFVLLIAGINYINLATARSADRSREVGVRKVSGARRGELVRQFLVESTLTGLAALLLGAAVAEAALPWFNSLTNKDLSLFTAGSGAVWGWLALATALYGLAAGLYPAFYLSRFQPATVLKGATVRTGGGGLRKSLVVFQFAISIFLLVGVSAVQQQLHFIQNTRLGFDRDQVLILRNVGRLPGRAEPLRQRLLQIPGVQLVAATDGMIGGQNWTNSINRKGSEQSTLLNFLNVGYDFLPALGIEFKEGRNFSPDFPTDSVDALILNETAVRQLGLPEPVLGQQLVWGTDGDKPIYSQVVGVVRDFHFTSLRAEIKPFGFAYTPGRISEMVVKIGGNNIPQTIAGIEAAWPEQAPGQPIDFYFLDESIQRLYRAETNFGAVTAALTLLGILIACLGLFGLAAFMAEQRTKEIGIRKVLGATVAQVTALLTGAFLKLVLLAIVLATPVAWWAMHQWLQDFAYHIDLSWWTFALAGAVAVVIAFLTVSFQSIKAALANPVQSLRSE